MNNIEQHRTSLEHPNTPYTLARRPRNRTRVPRLSFHPVSPA
jgi:hypothetical protein